MPLIPWLPGGVAAASPSVALALVLKNLVFGIPLAKIVWDGVSHDDWRVRRATIVALAYVNAEAGVAYLLFVAAFASSYLLAWGVARRLMPLVVPTVLFAAWALSRNAPGSPACAPRPDRS